MAEAGSGAPFGGLIVHREWTTVALVDLDQDGDTDVAAAPFTGSLRYFRNSGGPQAPVFGELTGAANPLAGLAGASDPSADFADLDLDGDFDLVIGGYGGGPFLAYFRNTGNATTPAFVAVSASANPFASLPGGDLAPQRARAGRPRRRLRPGSRGRQFRAPLLRKYRQPGDAELRAPDRRRQPLPERLAAVAAGRSAPSWSTSISTATATSRPAARRERSAMPSTAEANSRRPSPRPGISRIRSAPSTSRGDSSPHLADLDGDGDLDLLTGDGRGHVVYFANAAGELFDDGFESGDTRNWSLALP